MSVNGIGPEGCRDKLPLKAEESPRLEAVRETDGASRTDRVEISGEGRALARQAAEADKLGISPERLAQIRARLEDGTYQGPAMREALARRILDSGDL